MKAIICRVCAGVAGTLFDAHGQATPCAIGFAVAGVIAGVGAIARRHFWPE